MAGRERYELRRVGVYDRLLGKVIRRGASEWAGYVKFTRAGGVAVKEAPKPAPARALTTEQMAALELSILAVIEKVKPAVRRLP